MDEFIEKPVRTRRVARRLERVGVVLGCVVALGAGYAAAAGGIGSITVFSTGLAGGNGGYEPRGLAAGPDGALWLSAVHTNADPAIARVSTDGTVDVFTTGLNAGGNPGSITEGPDGNVWFADEWPHAAIGRITPAGTITEFPTPSGVGADGVAPGLDGNIWFAGGSKIGRITPSGQMTVYGSALNQPSNANAIAEGPDGALWFSDQGPPAGIGRITPDGTITEYTSGLSPTSAPRNIVQGPDGDMWFLDNSAVGRIDPSGQITEFAISGLGYPYSIAAGPDGNMWFADYPGMVGSVTPDGTITMYAVSSADFTYPLSVATGPDGKLWFTGGNPTTFVPAVARIDVGAPAASVASPHVGGSARQGDAQSCDGALWSDWAGQQPSTTAFGFDGYQWLLDSSPIAGQTAQSYTPTAGDVGHQLSCKVTATYTLFPATVSATSAAVTIASAANSSGGGGGGAATSTTSRVTATTTTAPPPPPPVRTPAGGTTAHATAAALIVLGVETVVLHAKPPKLHVTVRASQACTAVLVLRDSKGNAVATWKLQLARGADKLVLVLPQKARHQGRDTLLLQAGSGKTKIVPVTIRA